MPDTRIERAALALVASIYQRDFEAAAAKACAGLAAHEVTAAILRAVEIARQEAARRTAHADALLKFGRQRHGQEEV